MSVFQGGIDMNMFSFDDNVSKLFNGVDVNEHGINCDGLNIDITDDEVTCMVKSLKNNKACGIDGIPSEFFKHSINTLLPVITRLFNSILTSGHFPKAWSIGMIIPLHKKGNMSDPGNFRGISLLNIFSKIFTGILNKRLTEWCDINNIIPECQAGFRKGYSTIDNVFVLHSLIQKCFSKKAGKCYCLFVDFSKAFDSVPRDKLLFKLFSIGIRGKFFNVIKSLFKTVCSCIKSCNCTSKLFDCPLGVRQGCMCSPLQFSIFISILNDEVLQSRGNGVKLSSREEIKILKFADDVVLMSDNPSGLRQHILALSRFCNKWGMKVNRDKTKVIVFRRGGRLRHDEKWFLNGKEIECVSSYKYLGVTFSTGNTWGKATTILAQQGEKTLAAIRGISFKVGGLPFIPYFKIIDASLSPVLLYGAEIWGYKSYKPLEKVHIKACKKFLGVSIKTTNVAVLGECGRLPLFVMTAFRCINYWCKILRMPNHRYPYKCYKMLHSLDNHGHINWASHVKNLLFNFGFGIVWINQDIESQDNFLISFSTRLKDVAGQEWFAEVCTLDKLSTYREFKTLLNPERYLLTVEIKSHRIALSRLRCSSHSLMIEAGRWQNIDRENRLCILCDDKDIEDEFHFVLICNFFTTLRTKYLPLWVYVNPTQQKLYSLLNTSDSTILAGLAAFVYHALNLRNSVVKI